MQSPLIGITAYENHPRRSAVLNSLAEAYTQAILQAGGVPVMLPVGLARTDLDTLGRKLDGVVFSGGGDMLPERYGGQPHPKVGSVNTRRDDLEIALVQMAVRVGMPFLGICRGIQVLNVALGGTLYEDLADQFRSSLRHDCYPDIPRDHLAHAVEADPQSRLVQITGSSNFMVNSLHHQGLRGLAPSLRATAWAPDGLIEAVELPEHPFGLGVQWHPESIPAVAQSPRIFQALVEAARDH